MTNREFYTNIMNGILTDVEKEFAIEAIAKLDKYKMSPKEQEKAAADAIIREEILAFLSEEPMIESDIAAAIGVTGPKARAEIKKLVTEGRVTKVRVKVPKRGEMNGYIVASSDSDTSDSDTSDSDVVAE